MEQRPNVVRLTAKWKAQWPESPPVADALKFVYPDRWVRFHGLPGSKRYADTADEYAEILSRHHAVLDALGGSSLQLVITPRYVNDEGTLAGRHWQTIEVPQFDNPLDLFVDLVVYPSPPFNDMLAAVADGRASGVITAPDDLRWLYHPYDGGADVIATTTAERDDLKANFTSWLSARPDGL